MRISKTNSIDRALKSVASIEALQVRINGICMMPLIKDEAMVLNRNQRRYLPGNILV